MGYGGRTMGLIGPSRGISQFLRRSQGCERMVCLGVSDDFLRLLCANGGLSLKINYLLNVSTISNL